MAGTTSGKMASKPANAFAALFAGAKAKQSASSKAAAAPDDAVDDDDELPMGDDATTKPKTPVFKGSGLGAGPRHFVDPGASCAGPSERV